jgi:carboxyl-terminal processing protease
MRPVLICLLATLVSAADPPTVRELVDRLKGLEAQVALIERESAQPIDRASLWAGATRGLVEAADPHGAYLTASELAIHGLGNEPQRVALGFDWRREASDVLVTRVVPGSPAAKAGIHPGCLLLSVDGHAASGDRRAFADALARGKDRKHLRIRPAEGDDMDLDVTRSELLDDGVARAGVCAPSFWICAAALAVRCRRRSKRPRAGWPPVAP